MVAASNSRESNIQAGKITCYFPSGDVRACHARRLGSGAGRARLDVPTRPPPGLAVPLGLQKALSPLGGQLCHGMVLSWLETPTRGHILNQVHPHPRHIPGACTGRNCFFFLPLGTCAHGVPTTLRPPELNSPEGFSLFRQPRASSPKTKAPRANPGNRKAHGDGDVPITTRHREHLCSHRGVPLVPSPRRPSAALNPLQTPQSPHRGVEDEQTNKAGIKPGARGAAPARGWFYFLPHFSSGRPPFP